MANTLIPERHLYRIAGKTSPVCVLVGDSIATEEPGLTSSDSGSLYGILRREFAIQNAHLTPTWYNRALGASRFDHLSDNKYPTLDDTGLTVPAWPGVNTAADSWMDAIELLDPDVLFINLGMNDRDIFPATNFIDVMLQLRAQDATYPNMQECEVVFLTNMVPHFYSGTTNIGGLTAQNGRLFVAEQVRTFCQMYDFGYIDVGRAMCRQVAGFDPDRTYLRRAASQTSGTTPETFTECDRDFGLTFTMAMNGSSWTSRMKLNLSQQEANAESWLEIYDNGGNVAVEFVMDDSFPGSIYPGRYGETISSVPAATSGNMTFEVFVRGSWCSVVVEGEEIFAGIINRAGGRFEPVLSYLDGRNQPIIIESYYIGIFVDTVPELSFTDFYGSEDDGGGVTGGNDQNHPSSEGWGHVFTEAIKEANLRVPDLRTGNGGTIQTRGLVNGDGIMADDSTATIDLQGQKQGVLLIHAENGGVGAAVGFAATSSPVVHWSQTASGTTIATAGTDLAGTTGADGDFTISVKDGEIDLENRRALQLGTVTFTLIVSEE